MKYTEFIAEAYLYRYVEKLLSELDKLDLEIINISLNAGDGIDGISVSIGFDGETLKYSIDLEDIKPLYVACNALANMYNTDDEESNIYLQESALILLS